MRPTNEDSYAIAPSVGLFAVADGVGGNAAGEVASRMAVESVVTLLQEIAAGRPDLADAQETAWHAGFAASLLARAVEEANAVVCSAAARDPAKAGMGTTFTGLLFVLNDRAVIAHAGNSRAYLLRGGSLSRLTQDHTLVAAYMQAGAMTREEASVSEMRNVIVRAVGGEEAVEVDTRIVAVEPGDTLLLASDGLHGVLDDAEIAAVLLVASGIVTRAAAQLVERANDAGGPDNVTVVLVRVG